MGEDERLVYTVYLRELKVSVNKQADKLLPFMRATLDNHRFEPVRHDVISPYYAETDEIYNLACPASPPHYRYNAIKTVKTSIYGAMNMLGLAKRTRAKILQTSTSEVYGDPAVHLRVES